MKGLGAGVDTGRYGDYDVRTVVELDGHLTQNVFDREGIVVMYEKVEVGGTVLWVTEGFTR